MKATPWPPPRTNWQARARPRAHGHVVHHPATANARNEARWPTMRRRARGNSIPLLPVALRTRDPASGMARAIVGCACGVGHAKWGSIIRQSDGVAFVRADATKHAYVFRLRMGAGDRPVGLHHLGWPVMMTYESQPGPTTVAPRTWPADAAITRDASRPTLVLFAHPRCPLRARRSMSRNRASWLTVRVELAAHDDRATAGRAERLRRPDEPAARRSRRSRHRRRGRRGRAPPPVVSGKILTSGHVVLYDAGGRLLPSGWHHLAARGHRGDNAGCRCPRLRRPVGTG